MALTDLKPAAQCFASPRHYSASFGFVVLLVLLVLVAFPEVAAGTHTFFFRDFGLFGYPLAHLVRESFWKGELPFWNPYNDCGIPFLAQWNTMVFYPFSLIYVLLPLSWSLGVFCLAHLLWGGWGMFVLARRRTQTGLSAAVAGVAYALSGLMLHALMWPNDIAGLAWAPWVWLLVERASKEGGSALILAAAAGALQMLSGAPEVILMTWLTVGVCQLGSALSGGNKEETEPGWVRRAFRVSGIGALVAGLAAVQLLPFLHLLSWSQRGQLPNSAGWAMPEMGWVNYLVPLFGMHPGHFGVYAQQSQHWTSSYYVGIGTSALSIWAALFIRTWPIRVLAVLAFGGVVLAMGEHGWFYPALRVVFPPVTVMRYPIKCVVLTTMAVPLLAAYAVSALTADSGRMAIRSFLGVSLGLAAVVAFALAWTFAHSADCWPIVWNGLSRCAFLGLLALSLVGIPHWAPERSRPALWACLPLICGLDGITHFPHQNPTAPRWVYEAGVADNFLPANPRPKLGESRAMVSPQADYQLQFSYIPDPAKYYLSRRAGLFNNINLLDDIPKINGMFSLYPKHEAEVLTEIYATTNCYPERLADFLAVSQVSSRSNLFSWDARKSALPLITAGQKPVFMDGPKTLDALIQPCFDPRAEVYLPADLQGVLGGIGAAEVDVEQSRFAAHQVEVSVRASAPALVVVSQTFYPCWRGYVDGKSVPIWRANHAFQAVAVPAGEHRVELRYEDHFFQQGALLSGLSLSFCVFRWFRGKPSAPPAAKSTPAELIA